jgi:hypothetical protein
MNGNDINNTNDDIKVETVENQRFILSGVEYDSINKKLDMFSQRKTITGIIFLYLLTTLF